MTVGCVGMDWCSETVMADMAERLQHCTDTASELEYTKLAQDQGNENSSSRDRVKDLQSHIHS